MNHKDRPKRKTVFAQLEKIKEALQREAEQFNEPNKFFSSCQQKNQFIDEYTSSFFISSSNLVDTLAHNDFSKWIKNFQSKDGAITKDFKKFIILKNQEYNLKTGKQSKIPISQSNCNGNDITKNPEKDMGTTQKDPFGGKWQEKKKNSVIFFNSTSLELKEKHKNDPSCCNLSDTDSGDCGEDVSLNLGVMQFPAFGVKNKFSY